MPREANFTNPFAVQTPEELPASVAVDLWVDVFTDFFKIAEEGHSLLVGPRGCGKSMMFRFLEPDCQILHTERPLKELDFVAVLVTLKNYPWTRPDGYVAPSGAVDDYFREHQLTAFAAANIFHKLSGVVDNTSQSKLARRFANEIALPLFQQTGLKVDGAPSDNAAVSWLKYLAKCLDTNFKEHWRFLKDVAVRNVPVSDYQGALTDYHSFLVPLVEGARDCGLIPHGPLYLLMDDADWLPERSVAVVNSWIATRTSGSISVKASSRPNYPTYGTLSGRLIESPHDFSRVNVTDVYTSSRSRYRRRVEDIAAKRLTRFKILRSPEEFFPVDEGQEAAIKRLKAQIVASWSEAGRGSRARDDAYRYGVPDYIKSLGGTRKQRSTFRYAGLDMVINLSSGVVRHFLDDAARMYTKMEAANSSRVVDHISPQTQHDVVHAAAEALFTTEYENVFTEETSRVEDPISKEQLAKDQLLLRNLLDGLGGLFHLRLLSDHSERRVFSVAVTGPLLERTRRVVKLGVRLGFLHEHSIGNKDGTGRTRVFVLTRRLAPRFLLDPTSFAGYLQMSPVVLEALLDNAQGVLRAAKAHGVEQVIEEAQLSFLSE